MSTTSLQEAYPYGIRQIMLTPYTDAQGTVLGDSSYPLPVAMTMAFSETEQFDELRGDDVLVAVHGRGPQVDWTLEAGGMPIKAWSIVSGAAIIEEGVTPTRKVRLRKSGDDQRPYFRTDGRVISDSGGSVNARIYRCKANGRLQADHKGGSFQTTSIDGIGIPLVGDGGRWLYEIIQSETDTPLSSTPEANPLGIPESLAVGDTTATSVDLSWDAVTNASKYNVQQSSDNGSNWSDVSSANGGQPTSNSTTVDGLTASTSYQFKVCATDSSGNNGEYCTPVLVTTPAT